MGNPALLGHHLSRHRPAVFSMFVLRTYVYAAQNKKLTKVNSMTTDGRRKALGRGRKKKCITRKLKKKVEEKLETSHRPTIYLLYVQGSGTHEPSCQQREDLLLLYRASHRWFHLWLKVICLPCTVSRTG